MRSWDIAGVVFLFFMVGISVFGLTRIETNTEDVLQWLPDQSEARAEYDYFKQQFVSDDFVILTWPGCATDDPRLRKLSDYLRKQDDEKLIDRVTSGYDVAKSLGKQLGISRKAVVNRMRGVFFGTRNPDQTCVLVDLNHDGSKRRGDVMDFIKEGIQSVEGLEFDSVSMAGYPFIATYIDQQLGNSYRMLMLPSILLATVISFLCLRNIVLGGIVFLTSLGAATASVAIAPALGYMLGGLMSIIPALVFVLATSGSIHLMRYSLEAIGDPNRVLAIGWRPCVISTLTTAVGMLSLTRSEFPAIRQFGLFCAIGVGFALAFQLIMVPWLLTRFGQPGLRQLAERKQRSTFWSRLGGGVSMLRWPTVLVFVSILITGVLGLSLLKAEVEVEKLFRESSPIIRSLKKMETDLSPMDQTEVLLIFDQPGTSRMYQRASYAREVQQEIEKLELVGAAYSLVSFLPKEPVIKRPRDVAKRSTFRSYLDRERENFADGGLLAIDHENNAELWRISVRFPFTEVVDFEKLRDQIKSAIDRVAKRAEARLSSEPQGDTTAFAVPRVIYTGHGYLFHHAQLSLLKDLFFNFLLAFAIIAPLLVVILRSFKIGLIAMVPNIFPTVVVFGALGWLTYPVDMALAMTACVALGIAVDDTTHFLVRFRDFGGSLSNIADPICKTLEQCGPAMWHTTLIASASLMTYYFSSMLVVSRFAWAISLLLAVALVADVLMLPALLLIFDRVKSKSN